MAAELERQDGRDLSTIAAEVRHEHEQAGAAFETAVQHAVRCGHLLDEAKATVKHGEWGAWLDEHFPASRRTAQNYMRLAARAEDAQRLAHLGVAGALTELASPRAAGRLDAAAEHIERGDDALDEATDIYVAYLFQCERPVPERFRKAMALLVEFKAKDDSIGSGAVYAKIKAAATAGEVFTAQRDAEGVLGAHAALKAEIAQLVPEFDDLAWRIGLEERAAEALRSIGEAIEEIEGVE